MERDIRDCRALQREERTDPYTHPREDSRSVLHHDNRVDLSPTHGESWKQRQDSATARDPACDFIASSRPGLARLCKKGVPSYLLIGTIKAQLSGRSLICNLIM